MFWQFSTPTELQVSTEHGDIGRNSYLYLNSLFTDEGVQNMFLRGTQTRKQTTFLTSFLLTAKNPLL